ncbi:MAG: conjugative transposon protein TraN [Bacteroidales bacterium]|jgi:conjugative transposon TraN protein|nr:conjugative transposon protein TraN [Bacteroidales bacterium]
MKKAILILAITTSVAVHAQSNDLYQGLTQKIPYGQMVTPYGVQVTFSKTVHIIFPAAVRYVDLGSAHIIAGKADGAENVVRVKATTEGFPGETNFSVICDDGSFYSFNAKYANEPEILNIEMKDFLENESTTDYSHSRMNIYFRELGKESPLLVKLIMESVYKNNDREIRHLGSKRFGVQFIVKGIYIHNGLFYFHTQTKNSSNVAFNTDFIRFKIVDKKVAKRTAIQETTVNPVRSHNEIITIDGNSTVRTVYAIPQFVIPDDKILEIELVEKNGGRHQTIWVENSDIVNAKKINELKIK